MTVPASIIKLTRQVGAVLTSRRAVAAAPVVAVSLVVGVAVLSNRPDPAKVETLEEAGPPALRLVSTSQGVGDVIDEQAKTKATAKAKQKAAAATDTSKKSTTTEAATPVDTAAPTTAPPATTSPPPKPQGTAPETSTNLIGPVPPEPWPQGCCAPLTNMGFDSPYGEGGSAVAVKVSNATQADPQTGLNRADLIYEEPSHDIGSVSRFLAVFHSRNVDKVGAVRSARTSDPPLLLPLGRPVLAYAGANPKTQWIVDVRQGQGWFQQARENHSGASAFIRQNSTEHGLFVSRNRLQDEFGGVTSPPKQQFSFLKEGQTNAGSQPASRVDLQVAGTKSGFIWDDNSRMWLRFQYGRPHVNNENGAQIGRSSVIVLTTRYQGSFADYRSLEAVTFPMAGESSASGQAWVLTGNTVTQGTWRRNSDGSLFDLKDTNGNPIGLQPGPVYVGLVSAPPTIT
ncbi:MAG: DUF3048 domain-containing protein [Microthrixaceae bacterium]|nr:DUF3048 domain-containing protein [Microthrixaceae bacterium]